jgi:hypothetical protein
MNGPTVALDARIAMHLRLICLSLAAALFSAPVAFAQGPEWSRARPPGKCIGPTVVDIQALQKAKKLPYGPMGPGTGLNGTGYSMSQIAGFFYTNVLPDGKKFCR